MGKTLKFALAILLFVVQACSVLHAAELRIAVASNFYPTMQELAARFEKEAGHRLLLSSGSTGKHFAQIHHGAPFELFFAADSEHAKSLETAGLAVADTRFTYAKGRLFLCSTLLDITDASPLHEQDSGYLAMANPYHAPYGKAAQQVLQSLGVWDRWQPRLVLGENIGQAFQFMASGNATLGIVANSQRRLLPDLRGWLIPENLHEPIEQQAVILKDSVLAREFTDFMQSPRAKEIIQNFGYALY